MYALYVAKVYSDFTRFDDLCNQVAVVLNAISKYSNINYEYPECITVLTFPLFGVVFSDEGNCQEYNYEISTHGPYNNESVSIYKRAQPKMISNYDSKAYNM